MRGGFRFAARNRRGREKGRPRCAPFFFLDEHGAGVMARPTNSGGLRRESSLFGRGDPKQTGITRGGPNQAADCPHDSAESEATAGPDETKHTHDDLRTGVIVC
jgi:hypothetical protein